MDENLLDKWVRYLSCGKGYASASCDFAELIWSDAVTQQQQIELLKTGHANVRRAVAWAVTDLSLDNDAMRYLMNRCFNDSDAVVRRYVWGAMRQTRCLSFEEKQHLIEKLEVEQDEVVLRLVSDVRATPEL
ncbi:MAG TPA: hypothetical protein DEF45_27105 [Rhodopirellula sp.]|nr:hypothetical protein [Rhodopirellula sp.]